jgi:hypothetical protein
MLLANVLLNVFQLAAVVDRSIVQIPEFMAVAPALTCVLKNSRPAIVMGPENAVLE